MTHLRLVFSKSGLECFSTKYTSIISELNYDPDLDVACN